MIGGSTKPMQVTPGPVRPSLILEPHPKYQLTKYTLRKYWKNEKHLNMNVNTNVKWIKKFYCTLLYEAATINIASSQSTLIREKPEAT